MTALNHRFVAVDMTSIGIGSEADNGTLPFVRFNSWKEAEAYLATVGGNAETIKAAESALRKVSAAVVTIV